MFSRFQRSMIVGFFILAVSLSGCEAFGGGEAGTIKASGVVEVVDVSMASELGGKVMQVEVAEGDEVVEGQVLFKLEDELLQVQHTQAQAAYEAALANLSAVQAGMAAAEAASRAAQAGVEVAQANYDAELALARLEDLPARFGSWNQDLPDEFSLPDWYFEPEDYISAARAESEAAAADLTAAREVYAQILEDTGNSALLDAHARVFEAQAAFLVVEALEARPLDFRERAPVEDELERLREQAEDELELAQQAFDDLLAEIDGEQVLAARGRLIVARERYEAAMDQLQARLTGEHSLRVQAARAMLAQAQALAEQTAANAEQLAAGVAQAEGAVAQAQAALNLVQLQLERLVVRASIPGVVLTRSVEPGEILPPGMGAITIGQMEKMTITVYIPEDRYGEITLGDAASVTADSFPDVVFPAVVVRISDQAEYTPRNVQTEEDRKSTVFAIDLSVQDDAGLLKPGMPADVLFDG